MRHLKTFLLLLGLGLVFYSIHFNQYFNHFSDSLFVFQDQSDANVYLWNTWHFKERAESGQNPFFTDHMFYPLGASLWMHAHTAFFGLINLVVSNPYLAINLGLALSFVLLFTGFTFLANSFLHSWSWAIVVGYLTTFCSYFLAKAGVHYNLVLMFPVPWVLYFVYTSYHKNGFSLKTLILLAGGILLSFFIDYYAVFYSLALLALYVLWNGFCKGWFQYFTKLKALILFGVLVLGHFIVRLMRISGMEEKGALWAAADIRQLITPLESTYFFKNFNLPTFPFPNDNLIFLGYGLLFYFIVAVLFFFYGKYKENVGFWLFSSVVLLMVVVPVVKINEETYWYNLTASIHFMPFVNHVRAPDRFVPLLIFTMALFTTYVFSRSLKNNIAQYGIIGLMIGLGFISHKQDKMQIQSKDNVFTRLMPNAFEPLDQREIQSILFLPFGIRDGYQSYGDFNVLYPKYIIEHQKKTVGGYISRVPEEIWKYYRDNTFLDKVVKLQKGEEVLLTNVDVKIAMADLGIDAICYNKMNSMDYPELHRKIYPLLETKAFIKTENAFISVYRLADSTHP
jgi:hypothetical protein